MPYRLSLDDIEWRDVGDEVLILSLNSATYFSLSGSGVILWKALLGGAGRDDLVDSLVSRFDVAKDQVERDVDSFISSLKAVGLVTDEPG